MTPEKFSLAVQNPSLQRHHFTKNVIDLAQNKVKFLLDFLIIYTYSSVLQPPSFSYRDLINPTSLQHAACISPRMIQPHQQQVFRLFLLKKKTLNSSGQRLPVTGISAGCKMFSWLPMTLLCLLKQTSAMRPQW